MRIFQTALESYGKSFMQKNLQKIDSKSFWEWAKAVSHFLILALFVQYTVKLEGHLRGSKKLAMCIKLKKNRGKLVNKRKVGHI
jgi:hypothetical protein